MNSTSLYEDKHRAACAFHWQVEGGYQSGFQVSGIGYCILDTTGGDVYETEGEAIEAAKATAISTLRAVAKSANGEDAKALQGECVKLIARLNDTTRR